MAFVLNIIPHLHKKFLFQCDVARSFNRYEDPSNLVTGCRTLYQLFRYITLDRVNAVF